MTLYPLRLTPYFRHGSQTPWGGRALGDLLGKAIPDDRTGESLEVSAFGGMESIIANGEFQGQPLSFAISQWGEELTGAIGGGEFPLLIKLLDARDALSVQVHPGDEYAKEHEGKLGKSEAWVVLSAPPDAQLVYGMKPLKRPLSKIVEENALEEALNWVSVQPGDVLYIPHGMVHALGKAGQGDLVVYEVQQSSDVTYRFWDWGRTDAEGKARALHTRAALDVTRPELRLDKVQGATLLSKGGSVTHYIASAYFELSRLNVAGDMPLPEGRMLLITALGPCLIKWPGGALDLAAFDSVLIPAGLAGAVISGRLSALCASVGDRESLKEALGYRAGSVAGLTD